MTAAKAIRSADSALVDYRPRSKKAEGVLSAVHDALVPKQAVSVDNAVSKKDQTRSKQWLRDWDERRVQREHNEADQVRSRHRSALSRVPVGRLTELSGTGAAGVFSTATALIAEVQAEQEPVAFVQLGGGTLFPPDLAEAGVDLSALVIVRVPEQEGAKGMTKAAEVLLRSGAFGLVVVDIAEQAVRGVAWQSRVTALARQHESRVVALTRSSAAQASLGPMVSLRFDIVGRSIGAQDEVSLEPVRNKIGADSEETLIELLPIAGTEWLRERAEVIRLAVPHRQRDARSRSQNEQTEQGERTQTRAEHHASKGPSKRADDIAQLSLFGEPKDRRTCGLERPRILPLRKPTRSEAQRTYSRQRDMVWVGT